MSSTLYAEEVLIWGDTPPCQVELEPPLIATEVNWNAVPENPLYFKIGDCMYMVEYFAANQIYNSGFPFFITGIYKTSSSDPDCPDFPKEELFATAMAKIIGANIHSFIGNPNVGTVIHFFQGSCVEELYRYDPTNNDPVDWVIKMDGPTGFIPLFRPSEDNPAADDAQAFNSDVVEGNEWNLPILSGWRVCKGAPCCMASYHVMLNSDDNSVQSIVRIGDVIYNENFDCNLSTPKRGFCEPNCTTLFDEYFPPPVEFYDMKIFPSPADDQITLELPGLPSDNYQIQIVNQNGIVIFIFYMNLDEVTDIDLSQFSLDPGPYWIRIIKNGKPIAFSNFLKN